MTKPRKTGLAVGALCLLLFLAGWLAVTGQIRRYRKAAIRETRDDALIGAVMSNDAHAVQILLAQGADPNVRVLRKSRPLTFTTLCEQLAGEPRQTGQGYPTVLMDAAAYGNRTVVKMLLDAGADVNLRDSAGYTALHWAMGSGGEAVGPVTRLLVEHGADPNTKTTGGATVWQLAKVNPAAMKALRRASASGK